MNIEVKHCKYPWNELYVHVNGTVKPCCYSSGILGSLRKGDSLQGILTGPLLAELREYVSNNRIHGICAGSGCAFVRGEFPKDEWGPLKAEIDRDLDGLTVSESIMTRASYGHPRAMFQLACELWMDGKRQLAIKSHPRRQRASKWALRRELAMKWHQRACEGGEEVAAHLLGFIHRYEMSGAEGDYLTARQYFLIASRCGYGPSLLELGKMDAEGLGAPKDVAQAVQNLKQAGKKGEATAWEYLAGLIRRGDFVVEDKASAIELYEGLACSTRKRQEASSQAVA